MKGAFGSLIPFADEGADQIQEWDLQCERLYT
jgi:hypothetical protein